VLKDEEGGPAPCSFDAARGPDRIMGGEPVVEQSFSAPSRGFRVAASAMAVRLSGHPPLIVLAGTTSAQYALTLG
jgi:hypothetical protein